MFTPRLFARVPSAPHATRRPGRRRRRPGVEMLEDRCVPATFNVNSLADILTPPAGTVTLRSAIQAANTTPDANGNTINLTVPGVYQITLPPTANVNEVESVTSSSPPFRGTFTGSSSPMISPAERRPNVSGWSSMKPSDRCDRRASTATTARAIHSTIMVTVSVSGVGGASFVEPADDQ